MGSLGKQILAEEVKSSELLGEDLGTDETLSHEHVFADELEIGNDDSDGSKEGLKTFGELSTTEITGVHRNEHAAGWVEGDLIILKNESQALGLNSISDSLELDGTHRQHRGKKTVELVEATPGTRGGETLEDTTHASEVHLIGAIKDVNGLGEGRRKILGSLSLTGTGGASWRTTHLKMESLSGRHIDSISEGCDDESWAVSEVLITVVEHSISNLEDVISDEAIPIGLELGLPLEFISLGDSLVTKLLDNITGVSVHSDHAHNLLTHASGKFTLHHDNEFLEQVDLEIETS